MNKFFKIGCLVFVLLFIIAVIGTTIIKWYDVPMQSVAFLNSTNEAKSVTFERIKEDGKLSDTYTINITVEPNKTVIGKVPEGNYKVSVWKSNNDLYKSIDYKVTLKNSQESNYQLYRFDLAMDKMYAVVNLNALYEGGSFADSMSKAVGTKNNNLRIEKFYNGDSFFFVAETYTSRTFVDMDDKIPTNAKYGEMVYGLFAFPKTLPHDQVKEHLFRQIMNKTK